MTFDHQSVSLTIKSSFIILKLSSIFLVFIHFKIFFVILLRITPNKLGAAVWKEGYIIDNEPRYRDTIEEQSQR